nr:flagellar biosynthesis protein FlhB [Thermosinus carboxydivorans]
MRTFTASYSLFPNGTDFIFNLQRFNQEKTEEATPKRREEARKKGQVAKSVELGSALCLLAAFFTIKLTGTYIYEQLASYMQFLFSRFTKEDMTIASSYRFFLDLALIFLKIVLPIMLVILAVSLLVNFMQVGFTFSVEPLKPQLSRINPLAGMQRLFSKRSLVELVKSLFKVAIISYFIYQFIIEETLNIALLSRLALRDSLAVIAALTFDLAFRIGVVILVLAILDYYYQWWEHNQNLKMTKQEVKEEFKQTEGNPQIKSKIKERQRALAMRRMMQEVPKADVVVTNPTHFAIALLYEKTMTAPMVIAKGQDFMAERIKLVAKENGVAIVENKALARALYDTVEIGETVPPELYKAVAEVLAYVYRLKKRLS